MKTMPWPLKLVATISLAVVALGFPAQAQAPLDIRIALVIGNSAYAAAPLANPGNDARAMAEALRGLGFTVTELRDAKKEQMADAIAKVRDALQGKRGVGMLYYAGHGLQLDWHNYMVPVNADIAKAADVPEQAVDINAVIDAFKGAGNRMNILVLDACRDNPFAGTASGKGLAQLDAPPGTFLAYATAPGNVAEDGDARSGNGLYTQYLLQELKKPTARIEDVFKRVRFQVREKSHGRQIPWESTSLEDDFYFDRAARQASKPSREQEDALFMFEKSAWERIKDNPSADDLYAFLQLFPSGRFSEQAQFKLNRKERPAVVASPTRQEAASPNDFTNYMGDRLKGGDRFSFAVTDSLTKVTRSTFDYGVDRVDGDRVVPTVADNIYQSDVMGNVLRDNLGIYDPPLVLLPAEYAVGKSWEGRTTRITTRDGLRFSAPFTFKSRIVGRERIQTAAGSFDTFVIESRANYGPFTGEFRGVSYTIEYKIWASPKLGVPIRRQYVSRYIGSVYTAEVTELTSVSASR